MIKINELSKKEQERILKLHDEYEKFMMDYNKQHKLCPKCKSDSYSSTCVGYPFYHDDKEGYKDLNRCKCIKCGDTHIRHERVSH